MRQQCLVFFNARPEYELVGIFGSFADESATPKSDLDIAVAKNQPLTTDERLTLAGDLSVAVGREVDLVDLQTASGQILSEILASADWIIKRAPDILAKATLKQIYEYEDFGRQAARIRKAKLERFLKK